jgi:opacity protein-like surface antigen
MYKRTFGLAVVGLAMITSGVAGQTDVSPVPSRLGGSLNAIVAQPVGDFNDYVNVGFGIGGNFRVGLDPASITSLRFDVGFVNYGRETQEVCLSTTVGCRIRVDLTTTNNIFFGYGGLQFTVPSGPVRPYVNGGVGYSYFFTESSVEGTSNEEPFASTNNFDDGTFTWAAGGGLMIPISAGRTPISIDLGVRYNHNTEVDYLTKGAIEDLPDGSIRLNPVRSAAHLVTYMIGVSLGFGPGR